MQNINESEIRTSLISSQIQRTLANLDELARQYVMVSRQNKTFEEFLVDIVRGRLKQSEGIDISTDEQAPELNDIFLNIQTSLAEKPLDEATEKSVALELTNADVDNDSRLNAVRNRWLLANQILERLTKQPSANPKLNFSRVKHLVDQACERMQGVLKKNARAAVYNLTQRYNGDRFLLNFPPYAGRTPEQRFYLSIKEAPTSQAAKEILESAY